jgi:Asp-tRNA(Asn)/Glu-tRNA(Gln) amidotransferase B subunit
MGSDKAKIGMLVGAVMKEFKGTADGNDVKAVIESLLG